MLKCHLAFYCYLVAFESYHIIKAHKFVIFIHIKNIILSWTSHRNLNQIATLCFNLLVYITKLETLVINIGNLPSFPFHRNILETFQLSGFVYK